MREVSHRGPNKREFAGNIGRTGDGRNDGVSAGGTQRVRAVAEGRGAGRVEQDGTFFGGVFSVPSRAGGRGGGAWNVWNRMERFSGGCSVFHPGGRVGGGRTGGRRAAGRLRQNGRRWRIATVGACGALRGCGRRSVAWMGSVG
ncbi:hypothetical protein [Azospirillum palustre]